MSLVEVLAGIYICWGCMYCSGVCCVCIVFYLFDVDSMVSLGRELRVYTTIHTILSLFLQGVWLGPYGMGRENKRDCKDNGSKQQ